jgi:DNA repair exonuclease SbcCD ATPase subunit
LTADVDNLQKKNSEYASRLEKMEQMEKANAALLKSKAELEKKVDSLNQVSNELTKQVERVKKLEKVNESLEIEHDDISAELAECKKKVAGLEALKAENAKLKESAQQKVGNQGTAVNSEYEDQIKELNDSLAQWKQLAEVRIIMGCSIIRILTRRSAATTSTKACSLCTSSLTTTAKRARRRTRRSPSLRTS